MKTKEELLKKKKEDIESLTIEELKKHLIDIYEISLQKTDLIGGLFEIIDDK